MSECVRPHNAIRGPSQIMDNVEFYERFAQYYEQVYSCVDADETVRQWLTLLEANGLVPSRKARATNPPRIIDIGCGPGWHLAPWATNGFEVTGLDSSQTMLNLAHRRLLKASLEKKCRLLQADVRRLNQLKSLKSSFDLAVSHFNFPNLFPPQDLLPLFNGVAFVIQRDALWMMDHVMPHKPLPHINEAERLSVGNSVIIRSGRFDSKRSLYEQHWRVNELDIVENYWFHSPHKYEEVANLAGWKLKERFEWHPYETVDFFAATKENSVRVISMYCRA